MQRLWFHTNGVDTILPMHTRAVDERDSTWEESQPTIRAYFWTRDRTVVDCIEVSGSRYPEVVSWAEQEAVSRGAEVDLGLFIEDAGQPGIVWLRGSGRSGRDAPRPLPSS